jgi:hypothetical protein
MEGATMGKFILIKYDDGRNLYLRLSDIETIETTTRESPANKDGSKPPCPYQARITFITHRGGEIYVEVWLDTSRQVNIKRLIKKWTMCL